MHIIQAEFLKSATRASEWPTVDFPEIAVCGRSNVGKSTLLNAMLGHKLARVSRTPGRTRLINFFVATAVLPSGARQKLLISDLPGFGYAKVSRSERAQWQPMMDEYLTARESLCAVVLLCDSRRAAELSAVEQMLDETEIAHYLREHDRSVLSVLTKADKLSKHERKPVALHVQRLLGYRPTICSAQTGEGIAELWTRLGLLLRPRLGDASAAASENTGEAAQEAS